MRRSPRRSSRYISLSLPGRSRRARRNAGVQITAEFIDAANKVVYSMLDRTLRISHASLWPDMDREVKYDFARNAVLRMVEYLLDPTQAPRMNNEPIPSPVKVLGEKSPFAIQIKEIMTNDGRYRSTWTDKLTGKTFTFPIHEGTRTYTRTLWKETLDEFEDWVSGSQMPDLSFSGDDDLFSEDLMQVSTAKKVAEAQQEAAGMTQEEMVLESLDSPKYIEVYEEEEQEDLYREALDGIWATWLSGDYRISPQELNWFRLQTNRPTLTESALRAERLTLSKAMILHGDRMKFLLKDPSSWTADDKLVYKYLRSTLGPLKVSTSSGQEIRNPNWTWYNGVQIIPKSDVPTSKIPYVLSWHVGPKAKRSSYPGQEVDIFEIDYYRVPNPIYDLYLAQYHGPFASGASCPSCQKIQRLIGVGQRDFDNLLRRFYQVEDAWIRQQR